MRADHAGARLRGARRCRPRDRGGVRGHGAQEGDVRPARPRRASRARSSRPTPRRSTSTRSPRRPSGPQDVIGLHFFSPANVMRLLEIVRGAKTADDVLATALEAGARRSARSAWCRVCYGFIGNRMMRPLRARGRALRAGGRDAAGGRRRARGSFGMAMGILAVFDMAGLDIGHLTRVALGNALDERSDVLSPVGHAHANAAGSARRPAAATIATRAAHAPARRRRSSTMLQEEAKAPGHPAAQADCATKSASAASMR